MLAPQVSALLFDLGIVYNGNCAVFLRDWREMPVWVPDRSNGRANRAWFLGRCQPLVVT